MEQIERIGVSLEKRLLGKFDKLIAKQGYPSRSEAIRDLIRRQINSDRIREPKAKAIAVDLQALLLIRHIVRSREAVARECHPSAGAEERVAIPRGRNV